MSLFGAASSGVDPQSGAYLSKKQRIAMFRASRGMSGGDGGGSDKSNSSGGVQPKAAIVVANKFATITQSLNNTFQQSATNISDQAQTNKKSIENLYKIISDKRAQELKTEKQETRQASLDLERNKRTARENFVEGLSKAAAAAVAPLQKTANAVTGKVMGFWDKLKKALLLLGAAWIIDNLPEILDSIRSFDLSIDSFSTAVAGILPNVRGIFSIFDGIVRGILRGVRRVASTAFRIASKIATSAFRIAKKIFNAIFDVTSRVANAIFNGIKRLGSKLFNLYKNAKNALSGGLKSAQAAKNAKAAKPKGFFGNILDKLREGGSKVKSFASRVGGKLGFDKMQEGASNFMRGFKDFGSKAMDKLNPLKGYAAKEGIAKGNPASRLKGIEDLLGKVFNAAGIAGKAGKNLLKGIAKIARPLLRLPGVGIAVDIALNKAGGQGNEEALIRGLASGIAGMVGMKAGATIGAGIGTIAIPIPVIGTGVGGILGGLIGSILAANTADALAKAGMTMAGMETTSDETMAGNYSNIIENITNNNNTATVTPASDSKSTHPETSIKISPGDRVDAGSFSTPEGMQLSGGLPASTFNLEELPPIMSRMKKEKPAETLPQQEVQSINTRDPQSNIYRELAGKIYQLSEVGAN